MFKPKSSFTKNDALSTVLQMPLNLSSGCWSNRTRMSFFPINCYIWNMKKPFILGELLKCRGQINQRTSPYYFLVFSLNFPQSVGFLTIAPCLSPSCIHNSSPAIFPSSWTMSTVICRWKDSYYSHHLFFSYHLLLVSVYHVKKPS